MLIRELIENTVPSEYVYHASNLPVLSTGLQSVIRRGLAPSKEGYAGPGVYFAYTPDGGYYHVDKNDATLFRVKWADLVNKFGVYPDNQNGIERDADEIIVPGTVPASMLEVEYFPGEWWDLNSAYQASLGPVYNVEEDQAALDYATRAHAGQTRAGGDAYITHPIRVAASIEQYKKSHNLDAMINAALLHDTVEDTATTHEDLEALFGGLVASLVQELTSDPAQIQKMGKAAYLSHKMATMSSYALVIKLADRLDNVKDITTAKTPEWRAKYAAETNQILNYIEKNRVLSGTHKQFVQLIRNKLNEIIV